MSVYFVEEVLGDEELELRKPLALWVWADMCECKQGHSPRVVFRMNDGRMVAEIPGIFHVRKDVRRR